MNTLWTTCVCLLAIIGAAISSPLLSTKATVNLGTPIQVSYKLSDGLDGRDLAEKAASSTGNDWIGLYHVGDCTNPINNQDKHKCYVAWQYVPAYAATGTVTFEAEHYKIAGEYEARYFYGDDPTLPGALSWVGQGWVCNTYNQSSDTATYRDVYTERTGSEASAEVTSLVLAQCQCDPTRDTQTIDVHSCSDPTRTTQTACTSSCNDQLVMGTDASGTTAEDRCTGNYTIYSNGYREEVPRVWTSRTWGDTTITKTECEGYRAACGRCILDAVAYSAQILVTGKTGVSEYQDMKDIPGFEIGF